MTIVDAISVKGVVAFDSAVVLLFIVVVVKSLCLL